MAPIPNVALKAAIFGSRRKQKRIAVLTRIHETRLSKIVRGHIAPSPDERARLAQVLGKSEDELFAPLAVAS